MSGNSHDEPIADRRIRRTRRALVDALLELMSEVPLNEITVKMVCDRADVGRSTFYTHFETKDDLFATSFDYFRAVARSTRDDPLAFGGDMFRHAVDSVPMFHTVAASSAAAEVLRLLNRTVTDITRDSLRLLEVDDSRLEGLTRFIAGGLVGMMHILLESGDPTLVDDLETEFRSYAEAAIAVAAG